MRVAIIGAGFTGLTAAYELQKKGHDVTIFEKETVPGGLALGYQKKEWDWTLEAHYHHWFTNDEAVLTLAKEIGHTVIIKKPHTNWYVHGQIYAFDSIPAALSFPPLPLLDRLRNLATLGMFRINPFWKPLEKLNAHIFLPKVMGKKAYQMLWEPLFHNKFGSYAKDVSLAWFWARIKKRTQSLAYPEGGFLTFAKKLAGIIQKKRGKILYAVTVTRIEEKDGTIRVLWTDEKEKKQSAVFDKAIVTLPSFLFIKITPQLPESYKEKLHRLHGIGATNLILRLNAPFFPDDTYWLSVADTTSPVMAIVEHTNFMNKKHYHNEHLVYLGNYLPPSDPLFHKSKEELLALYDPFLKRINPTYRKHLIGYDLFKAPFAQPIIPQNYSKRIPPFTTPLKNIYLANIEQVYPWDRGTNYAVELGQKITEICTSL